MENISSSLTSLKMCSKPWLVWLSGLSAGLTVKELPVGFPVRAHAWVVGQAPSRGRARGSHTRMFLSLSKKQRSAARHRPRRFKLSDVH